jgi:Flp pilus assembly pilin Flp
MRLQGCTPDRGNALRSKPTKEQGYMSKLKHLLRDDKGQDMVEYAVLAAFISIVAIATIRTIGPLIVAIYVAVAAALA